MECARGARGEADGPRGRRAARLQRRLEARRADRRRAGALEAWSLGEGADERDLAARAQRQHATLVLQEDRALARDAPRRRVVLREQLLERGALERAAAPVVLRREHERRHARRRGVQRVAREPPLVDGVDEPGVAALVEARHLQVEPPLARAHALAGAEPVRDDHTAEAPLLAQHAAQQPRVLAAKGATQPVVRRHHRPRPRAAHLARKRCAGEGGG